jgi:hypothetical protein
MDKSLLKKPYDACEVDAALPMQCVGEDDFKSTCGLINGTASGLYGAEALLDKTACETTIAADPLYNATCEYLTTDSCDPEKDSVHYMFEGMYGSWTDEWAGVVVLAMALAILCVCLYLIVAILRAILKGRVAVWMHKVVNGQVLTLERAY